MYSVCSAVQHKRNTQLFTHQHAYKVITTDTHTLALNHSSALTNMLSNINYESTNPLTAPFELFSSGIRCLIEPDQTWRRAVNHSGDWLCAHVCVCVCVCACACVHVCLHTQSGSGFLGPSLSVRRIPHKSMYLRNWRVVPALLFINKTLASSLITSVFSNNTSLWCGDLTKNYNIYTTGNHR